ncbi:MAG: preprotein translocase subunit TatC [Blastochloris sp.]|nr:preprotein translocase subunit TatC [Blastochloris sp.]
MQDEPKPFLDHLEDLRWTIIKCALTLAISMGLSLFFTNEILQVLEYPLRESLKSSGKTVESVLIMQNMMDPLTITLQISLGAGLLLALPGLLFFIGQFVLPALEPREKRLILPTFGFGVVLFLLGVFFCYFLILPQTIQVSWSGVKA